MTAILRLISEIMLITKQFFGLRRYPPYSEPTCCVTEYMWVLTREKNPSAALVADVKSKIQAKGLNTDYLLTTLQDC